MTLGVKEFLSDSGPVARRLKSFELRPQQLDMAAAVEAAFASEHHLAVEAGTGVGKSFAYLIPAIQQVVNHGKKVVISTHTISLQEQLIEKDIPFLRAISGEEFSAVLCKGRSNYLCLRRLEQASRKSYGLFEDARLMNDLVMIEEWSTTTKDGSLADLPKQPAWNVWDKVCAEHGNCLGRRCRFFDECHYQASRRRIANGQILICNHALYFSDLALRRGGGSILPDYDFVILDEAHTIESVASDHFGLSLSESQIRYLMHSLFSDRNQRGFLATLDSVDTLPAVEAVHAASDAADKMFDTLAHWLDRNAPPNGRVRERGVIEDTLSPAIETLSNRLKGLLAQLNAQASAEGDGEVDPIEDDPAQASDRSRKQYELEKDRYELNSFINRVNGISVAVKSLLQQDIPDSVYWVEQTGRTNRRLKWTCSPINVAPHLKENLFDQVKSVILTSATLATGRQSPQGQSAGGASPFAFLRSRVGLTDGAELQLGSPFDYQTQMTLFLETALPAPDERNFLDAAMQRALHYIRKTEGRAFVLFTSYGMMDKAAAILRPELEALGYPMHVQGGQMTRSQLLTQFKSQDHSVLLGTDSFWQGVDVQGEALSNVIITKLPFTVPDKPLNEARLEAIREQGGNPFADLSLPEAIIKFKQGFGRLIRSKSDRGIVVVLDKRIVTKAYGKQFIQALPPCKVVKVNS